MLIKKLFILLFSTLFISNNNYVTVENDINNVLQASYITKNNNLDDNKTNEAVTDNLYGCWLLEEVAYWDSINTIKKNRPIINESKYIGSIFEYQKDFIKLNGVLYENIVYDTIEIDLNIAYTRLIQNFNNFKDKYKFNSSKLNRIYISAENFNDFGGIIDVINENCIVINGPSLSILAKKINPQNLQQEDIPKSIDNPNPQYLYGKWKIIDKYVVDYSKNYYENGLKINPEIKTNIASEYLGQIFEYQKDYCVFNGITYYKPIYAYDVELGATSMSEMMYFDWEFEPIILKYNLDNENGLFKYIQQSIIFDYNVEENIGYEPCYVNDKHIVFMYRDDENYYSIFLVAEKI